MQRRIKIMKITIFHQKWIASSIPAIRTNIQIQHNAGLSRKEPDKPATEAQKGHGFTIAVSMRSRSCSRCSGLSFDISTFVVVSVWIAPPSLPTTSLMIRSP